MALLSTANEHLEHVGARAADVVQELAASPWAEDAALGLAMQSLRFQPGNQLLDERFTLPDWLTAIENRRAVRASVRPESRADGPSPWVVEVDVGGQTSCVNVWINPDGSLYQLYPSDETLDEVQTFLLDIDHLVPKLAFMAVTADDARRALQEPAEHHATTSDERRLLQWLLRTPAQPAT